MKSKATMNLEEKEGNAMIPTDLLLAFTFVVAIGLLAARVIGMVDERG